MATTNKTQSNKTESITAAKLATAINTATNSDTRLHTMIESLISYNKLNVVADAALNLLNVERAKLAKSMKFDSFEAYASALVSQINEKRAGAKNELKNARGPKVGEQYGKNNKAPFLRTIDRQMSKFGLKLNLMQSDGYEFATDGFTITEIEKSEQKSAPEKTASQKKPADAASKKNPADAAYNLLTSLNASDAAALVDRLVNDTENCEFIAQLIVKVRQVDAAIRQAREIDAAKATTKQPRAKAANSKMADAMRQAQEDMLDDGFLSDESDDISQVVDSVLAGDYAH